MLSILIDACAITLKFSFYNPFLLFITILILWDNFPHSFIYQKPIINFTYVMNLKPKFIILFSTSLIFLNLSIEIRISIYAGRNFIQVS
jgi:hypothetical protein